MRMRRCAGCYCGGWAWGGGLWRRRRRRSGSMGAGSACDPRPGRDGQSFVVALGASVDGAGLRPPPRSTMWPRGRRGWHGGFGDVRRGAAARTHHACVPPPRPAARRVPPRRIRAPTCRVPPATTEPHRATPPWTAPASSTCESRRRDWRGRRSSAMAGGARFRRD